LTLRLGQTHLWEVAPVFLLIIVQHQPFCVANFALDKIRRIIEELTL
jgi:hypothetical protein